MESDHRIQASVRHELRWEPSLDETRIHSSVTDGIVSLSGDVPTVVERYRAENAAARAWGVRAVANELVVGEVRSERAAVRTAHAARTALSRIPDVSPDGIKVVVRDDVVKLLGEVASDGQRQSAIAAVERLPGVREVVSLLVVRAPDRCDAGCRVG
jgi:osmotically-inducible protein OsmY